MINRYKKYFNANIVLAVIFVATIGFMAVKTLPIQGVTNFIKAPLRDIRNDENTYVSKYEKTYADKFQYKYKFLNLHGAFAKTVGKKEVNGVFKMGGGYLISAQHPGIEQAKINKLIQFPKQYNYLFFQHMVNYDEDKTYPDGDVFDLYISIESRNKILRENNVDVLDMNEEADKQKINKRSMQFKTDHHWTPEAAFFGYKKIIEKLNEDYDCNISSYYTDINNFNVDIYENWFLGSLGKRTGHVYAGLDDISVIYPKFETNMTFSVPTRKIYRQGSYNDTVLNYERIYPMSYYFNNPYSVYIGGDYDYAKITNNNAPENKKLLIYKNSYMLPVAAFLSTCFKEVHLVDYRHIKNKTIYDYANEVNPDIIIINDF